MSDPTLVATRGERDHSSVNADIPIQTPPYIIIRLPKFCKLISDHRHHLEVEIIIAFALTWGGFYLFDWPLENVPPTGGHLSTKSFTPPTCP
ncbi:hypothetical protein L873DRAFT_1849512 [Choiromyces venosus 120613-1]|uniref:Uncharacterized protein n=1 Tax=Choiromyces venosus 120613-1 TaxID=1336337 RepID=A0A3N4ISW4_9PEZI|nr:hypothetical protein L873DRAFT_1849512 [Choiromyces venosus 120613-1]